MAIRVLIVDDHSVVREGLRMFLVRDPDLEVVGEAADGAEALEQARQMRPDVVVMDLLMPVMDGIAATRAIRGELPDIDSIDPCQTRGERTAGDAVAQRAGEHVRKDGQNVDVEAHPPNRSSSASSMPKW